VATIARQAERALNRFERFRRKWDWGVAHEFSDGSAAACVRSARRHPSY
jgi:hypothetical protein